MCKSRNAFTLIELLIVVAIIGILAAIAIPNFLMAQIRAKVSRAQADMRTIETGLALYQVDNNVYPSWRDGACANINPVSRRLRPLTTPVQYIGRIPAPDPFAEGLKGQVQDGPWGAYLGYDTYDYVNDEGFAECGNTEAARWTRGAKWRLMSYGPDRINGYCGPRSITGFLGDNYDPTNGTISNGDICKVGPKSQYPGNYLYPDSIEG